MNLIKDKSDFINIDIGQEDSVEQWIKVNALQTGFFRVKYSPEEQNRLLDPIKNQMLPAADRLGLQNDAFALMRSGHISATEFLSVAEAYTNETNASVCEDLAANLSTFDYLIWNEPYYPVFQEFALKIFDAFAEKVGWESEPDEGHLDALLRTTVLMEAGSYGSALILQGAKSRFDQYSESVNSVHPDIRSVGFGLAASLSLAFHYCLVLPGGSGWRRCCARGRSRARRWASRRAPRSANTRAEEGTTTNGGGERK